MYINVFEMEKGKYTHTRTLTQKLKKFDGANSGMGKEATGKYFL
jgi:hypothetical protein